MNLMQAVKEEFSPRMRGCSAGAIIDLHMHLVFPAYAGMFRNHHEIQNPSLRFPRVCGDVPMKVLPGCTTS